MSLPTPKWTRQPEKRPQQIMQAALEVFSEKGFRAATMEEIAQAAGVTKGTIYLYFSNKEELFIQTLQSQVEALRALMPRFRFTPEENLEQRARIFARAVLEVLFAPGMTKVIPLFLSEVRHIPLLRQRYIEEWLPEAGLGLAETLGAGMEAGLVRRLDPLIAARALTGLFSAFSLTQEVLGLKEVTPMSIDDIAETIVAIALRGVLAA